MIDMALRQYRLFIYSPTDWHDVFDAVVGRVPESHTLFRKVSLYDDPALFCHEAAHSMEFIRKGQYQRLCLPNYGWPIIQRSRWSKKMAENEARVFAQQEILIENLKLKNDGLLGPGRAGLFLASCTGDRYASGHYRDLILKYKEDLRSDCMEVFDDFIKYLVANGDTQASPR